MHYLIFTGGLLQNGSSIKIALKHFDKVIAVDSGARHCIDFKLVPDFVLGDFDSIGKILLRKFENKGSKILPFPPEKNATDTELAIDLAIANGASKITILGGVSGDRTDHLIGNLLLLQKKKFAKIKIKFADGNQEIFFAKNEVKVNGKIGDVISFIPIHGPIKKMASTGLKYKLDDYTLSIQGNHGISNEMTKDLAKVNFKNKSLLVIHTLSK